VLLTPTQERVARSLATLTPSAFTRYWRGLTSKRDRDLALVLRFRFDLLGFAKWCWPGLFPLPWNEFHRQALGKPDEPWRRPDCRGGVNRFRVLAAPRGVAKTTTGKARAAHSMAYGLDPYAIVLSADQPQALEISRHLRTMVGDGEFSRLYGPTTTTGTPMDWQAVWPEGRATGVRARSFKSQVRGSNLDAQRPTLVLVDDGERPDRVRNDTLRNADEKYLDDDVCMAGPREGGLCVWMLGTVLHPDAVIKRKLSNPGWHARRWQAMPQWPDDTDLWEQCHAIWADLTLGGPDERRAAALEFYAEHRAEMDAGAVVLDQVAEPLFRLYEYIWSQGLASFLREKQNEPRDPNTAIFNSAEFARCQVLQHDGEWVIKPAGDANRIVRVRDCRTFLRWDPSIGDPTSDDASIVAMARDKFGYAYVLDEWTRKRKISVQGAAAWEIAERFGINRGSLESNGFQRYLNSDFKRQRNERREADQYWQLKLSEDPSTQNKAERIGAMEPAVENGWLQFSQLCSPRYLMQWDDFPDTTGDHDLDGPDATEGGYARIGGVPRDGQLMGKGRVR
jgi:hypothetical protein